MKAISEYYGCFFGLCFYVGMIFFFICTVRFCVFMLQFIRMHIIAQVFPRELIKCYGKWAVVTGGTDGIGKAYARELARRGVNIVIISRNMDKLNAVAKQIEKEYGVDTKVIQMDFSKVGVPYEKLMIQLGNLDLEIGILVNNVGVVVPYPLLVSEMTETQIWDHVNVNVAATTLVTRALLPDMLLRGRGVIVNLSSLSAVAPTPYLNVYASTKAYIDSFTESLKFEYRTSGLEFQTLRPGYVNTQMIKYSNSLSEGGLFVPSAEVFAKHAVCTLGVSSATSGYWTHDIQYAVASLLPRWAWIQLSGYVNNKLRNEFEKNNTRNN